MKRKKINIAIDGPAASGKSTIGKKLAQKIGYQFLDSGLLFRHFAQLCQLSSLVRTDNFLENNKEEIIKLVFSWQKKIVNRHKFFQQLEKEQDLLSSPEIGNLASYLSLLPQLRQVILLFQRKLTQRKGWVVVGRDITSEVLPHAEIKIFLTADLETRLKRRHQEHEEKNSLNQIKKTLLIRDERDQKRAISPLKKTKDSWEIDTTNLSPNQIVEKIFDKAKVYFN